MARKVPEIGTSPFHCPARLNAQRLSRGLKASPADNNFSPCLTVTPNHPDHFLTLLAQCGRRGIHQDAREIDLLQPLTIERRDEERARN
jgi:hypothetical protein